MAGIYEGAMLGGVLLPEAEFIQVMIELLEVRKQDIIDALQKVQNAPTVKDAYEQWMFFQMNILKNPDVQLLVITNFYNQNGTQTWTFLDSESSAINKSGQISLKDVEDDLKQAYISQLLAQHLSGLFGSINDEMTEEEVNYAYGLKRHSLLTELAQAKYYEGHTYIYKNIIYGQKSGMYLNGQVADAFVNHLGYTHAELFTNLSLIDTNYIEHLADTSVKAEEFAISSLNFFHLLYNSTNTTGWYTGGDLILTDKTGKILANIQLKTTASSGEKAFGQISTKRLLGNSKSAGIVQELLALMDQDNQIIAQKFYEKFKTSGIIEGVEQAIDNTGISLAQENLELSKIDLHYKI